MPMKPEHETEPELVAERPRKSLTGRGMTQEQEEEWERLIARMKARFPDDPLIGKQVKIVASEYMVDRVLN